MKSVIYLNLILMVFVLAGCQSPQEVRVEVTKPVNKKLERDRQAILAMAGTYKVEFNFEEVVSAKSGYELTKPYHAEALEVVKVIEDTGDFISLQHLLLVGYEDDKSPIVIKHWRQDWQYEDKQLIVFRGMGQWKKISLENDAVAGTWSQTVYQVDDAPRYASYGHWHHVGDYSTWESGHTWRPLPRREITKRDDYQVMMTHNRHTITPAGWVHEQHNQKVVLNDQHAPIAIIAHEVGINHYTKTQHQAAAKADAYWSQTQDFWAAVRSTWQERLNGASVITIQPKVEGKKLYEAVNRLAETTLDDGGYNKDKHDPMLDQIMKQYITVK